MRDYAKIAPQFWTGETGRKIRRLGPEAVAIALYLLTCPHANAFGMYYLPLGYMACDVGMSPEGASEWLQKVCATGFCAYDDEAEVVWVRNMARFQIGEEVNPKDNRAKWIISEWLNLPKNVFLQDFYDAYGQCFGLPSMGNERGFVSPVQAPSKPLQSLELEKELEKEEKSVCLNACARVEHPEPEPAHEPVPAPRQPSIGFDQFFDAYPQAHRGGEIEAGKAWMSLKAHCALPGLPRIMDALGEWEASPEWAAQGGRFVPTAANFLEREYWQRKPRSPDACTAGTPRQGQPRAMTVAQKNSQDRDMMAKMLLAKKEAKNGCEHELLAGNLGESFAALPAGGQNPG